MESEYKACGKQLEYPPETPGVPIDIWTARQRLYAPGAIAEHRRERQEAEARRQAEIDARKRKPSASK